VFLFFFLEAWTLTVGLPAPALLRDGGMGHYAVPAREYGARNVLYITNCNSLIYAVNRNYFSK